MHEDDLKPQWVEEVRKYCAELKTIRISKPQQVLNLGFSIIGSEPFQVAYFFQNNAKHQVQESIEQWKPDLIYCQLLRTAKYVEDVAGIPKVMDFQDAFSKGIERRLQTDPWYLKPVLRSELKRLSRFEQVVFDQFDRCTIISRQDRDQMPIEQRDEITIVRNGVELNDFSSQDQEKTVDVLFAGNMGYPPNVDGAVFLAKEVMPLVREQMPNAKLMLAGARPDQKVQELASELNEVTGWVDDISECYAKAKVFAAPMMIGTGLQNKLLEAMAMEIPCVTSKLANNALNAAPNKDVLIGYNAKEYAHHIINLLKDKDLADSLAKNGHALIKQNFSWEGATKPLLEVFESLT